MLLIKIMKKNVFMTVALLLTIQLSAQQGTPTWGQPQELKGSLIRQTGPLRDHVSDPGWIDVPVRDEKGVIRPEGMKKEPYQPELFLDGSRNEDGAIQKKYAPINTLRTVTTQFAGMGYTYVNPADPSLCVGPNHIIQMINGGSGAYLKIFSKTGTTLLAQKYMDAITGKGGLGDPIALYDQLEDRYVITEFANQAETGSEGLVVAVSQTNDPTGSWNVYYFSTGTVFPDYPKFSVWHDAYYATTNNFTSSYVGSSVFAFDKAAMISGSTSATMVKVDVGNATKHFSMCPVTLQGTSKPSGGGLIAYMHDDAWTSSTADRDSIGLFEFRVNFTTPASSKVVFAASLATAAYNSDICTGTREQCVTQSGSTVKLESLNIRVMNQPVYRNFTDYEGIVLCHVVNNGSSVTVPRWYELKRSTGNWSINQQGTYTPDGSHRWLPAVCYNKNGDIAMAYNISGSTLTPGIRYTGRKVCDTAGLMTYTETTVIAGTTANGSTRFGDYNHLVIDPSDDLTFWFTAMHNSSSTWSTRIAAFKLPACNSTPTCAAPTALTSSSVTDVSANITWSGSSAAGSFWVEYKKTGATTWVLLDSNNTSKSVSLSGLTGVTTYDWRVRANCSGTYSNFASAQFTTKASCSDVYEPNASRTAAKAITVGTNVQAAISSSTDADWFSFSTSGTGGTNVAVDLTTLPADYDLRLYSSTGKLLKSSLKTGTTNERIFYNNNKAASYTIQVSGYNGAFDPNNCYNLLVSRSTSTYTSAPGDVVLDEEKPTNLLAFPNPSDGNLVLIFQADEDMAAQIIVYDMAGRVVLKETFNTIAGSNQWKKTFNGIQDGTYQATVVQKDKKETVRFQVVR